MAVLGFPLAPGSLDSREGAALYKAKCRNSAKPAFLLRLEPLKRLDALESRIRKAERKVM
jgi:hypothetical protein